MVGKNFFCSQADAKTIKNIESKNGFIVVSDDQIIATISETEFFSGAGLFMKPSEKSKLSPCSPKIVKAKMECPEGTECLQNVKPLFRIGIEGD